MAIGGVCVKTVFRHLPARLDFPQMEEWSSHNTLATLVIFRIVYYTFSTSILYNDWICLQTGYLFASYLRLAVVYFFQYPTSIAHFAHFFIEVRTGVYPGYLGELARYFGSASQVDVTTSEISVAISAAS